MVTHIRNTGRPSRWTCNGPRSTSSDTPPVVVKDLQVVVDEHQRDQFLAKAPRPVNRVASTSASPANGDFRHDRPCRQIQEPKTVGR